MRGLIVRNPDSESEDDALFDFMKNRTDLFYNSEYFKFEDGIYYKKDNPNEFHPFFYQIIQKRNNKKILKLIH